MHHSRIFRRLLVLACCCLLAFSAGAAAARAGAFYPSCSGVCESICNSHDGCDTFYVDFGVCFFWCMDGYNDAVYMGK